MMNLRRLSAVPISIVPAPVLRSVIVATGVVGLLAIGTDGLQNIDAAPRTDVSVSSDVAEQEAPQLASISSGDRGEIQAQTAMAEPLVVAAAGASITLNIREKTPEPAVETAPIISPQAPPVESASAAGQALPAENVPPTEPAPVQVAAVNPSDVDLSDIQPADAGKAAKSIELPDDCLLVAICIDRYLWALYERTPKEDTIKQVEWRKVTVERKIKVKGKTKTKMVTVSKAFTKLVDQDFTWKDPKAAERARMPMMDYVIGGMDRSFKVKLFRMLRAAEMAGLSPGITSAFRDDYRQSIASGLKAASNRSYHGGSLRGGYGYGVAADVVSVQGGTRNARWASSDKLWKWVDAHGKEFGIGRPYLNRDPPHVAPLDGQEYARHSRGTKQAAAAAKKAQMKKAEAKKEKRVATSDAKKTKDVAKRDDPRPVTRPRTATASR